MKLFSEQEFIELVRRLRWKGKIRCIYCKSENISKYGKDRKGFSRYLCKDCKRSFSDKTGTFFDGSQLNIEDWLDIINDIGKKSLRQISIEIGKPYNTVHSCAKKIKSSKIAPLIKKEMEKRLKEHEAEHVIAPVPYQGHEEQISEQPSAFEHEYGHHDMHPAIQNETYQPVHEAEFEPLWEMMEKPKVLMLGWEFYPKKVGGLGKVCFELSKALYSQGVDLTIVLPIDVGHEGMNIIPADFKIITLKTLLAPYMTESEYNSMLFNRADKELYGSNIYEESMKFALKCMHLSKTLDFDIIHAHDWMTFTAGLLIKEVSGRPLVLHVHTTEFDRGGGIGINSRVFEIEKKAFDRADLIIAVSNFTKKKIMQHYGIDGSKISVVHNAINSSDFGMNFRNMQKDDKYVVFLGRITIQKGPDYFLRAAKKVLETMKNVKFVLAGTGDMLHKMIELACELDISNNVIFTGMLKDEEVKEIYRMADIYIMPSISEPFGIVALEAMASGVPTIISKSSGVSEVINHCLKVDFWDVDEMANMIISCLKYDSVLECMSTNGKMETVHLNWDSRARKCVGLYNRLVKR